MTLRPWICSLAGIAVSAFAPLLARAEVPPALDRAPAGTPVVAAIGNLGKFMADVESTATLVGIPSEGMMGLSRFKDLLKTPGINPSGSIAIIMPPPKGDDDEGGPPIVIAPVSDFAAMAKAMGGEAGPGVHELKAEDHTIYAKDLGGGFVAISPEKGLIETFEGKAGNGPSFEKILGATGRAITESSDAFFVVDMQAMGPHLKEMMEGVKGQLQMAAAMSGGKADMTKLEDAIDGVVRDGGAAVLGIRKNNGGIKLDMAVQFKEGSDFAKNMNAPGKAGSLTGTIPNQPFLFAAAIDTTPPIIQKVFKNFYEAAKKGENGDALAGINPLKSLENTQGVSFFLGTPPSITNGIFLNTATYVKTTDPKGYIGSLKEVMTSLNGKQIQGVTYASSYNVGGGKAGDRTVDVWSLKMTVDPDAPGAEQVQMVQSTLFGAGAINGFAAEAPGGVIVTYSKNSTLLQQAMEAAGGANGLSQDKGTQTVTENLPSDRIAEGFIGVRSILETVTAFMGRFDFKVPEDLPPVGLAATFTGGGARVTFAVPESVLETVAKLNKAGDGDDADKDDEKKPASKDKTGQPKF